MDRDRLARWLELVAEVYGPIEGVMAGGKMVPAPIDREPLPTPPRRTHNNTFTAVEWDGHTYTFTPLQAACVKVLWVAWESGGPPLHQQQILTEAESDQNRLDHAFRINGEMHPAWGTMIVRAGGGRYALAGQDGT